MLARHNFHALKAHPVLIRHDVAQLYEAVPPKTAVQREVAEIVEPLPLQQFGGVGFFLSVLSHQSEILLQRLSFPLSDTSRQVKIHEAVGINVVQPCAVRRVYAYGGLPCLPPCRNVFLCQAVGLLHQLRGQFKPLFAFDKPYQPVHVRFGVCAPRESLFNATD